jgi:hypothetical protein
MLELRLRRYRCVRAGCRAPGLSRLNARRFGPIIRVARAWDQPIAPAQSGRPEEVWRCSRPVRLFFTVAPSPEMGQLRFANTPTQVAWSVRERRWFRQASVPAGDAPRLARIVMEPAPVASRCSAGSWWQLIGSSCARPCPARWPSGSPAPVRLPPRNVSAVNTTCERQDGDRGGVSRGPLTTLMRMGTLVPEHASGPQFAQFIAAAGRSRPRGNQR